MRRRRVGDWILTYSGNKFWPLDPRPEDICLEDAAHSLSQICRFGGHTIKPYYVAQHSVLVSLHSPPGLEKVGLLHDLPEYVLNDLVQPIKKCMPQFIEAEDRLWTAVCKRFDMDPSLLNRIKTADLRALVTERRDLFRPSSHRWSEYIEQFEPFREVVEPLTCRRAKLLFLNECRQLGVK